MSFWTPGVASPVSQNFLPVTTAAYSLGSTTVRWKGLYSSAVVDIAPSDTLSAAAAEVVKINSSNYYGGYVSYRINNVAVGYVGFGLGAGAVGSEFIVRSENALSLVGSAGAAKVNFDTAGFLLVTSHALGYGTGAGGAVTQLTSKSTGVTLNKPCGQITMHNAALAANTAVAFVLTNNTITSTDIIDLTLSGTISDMLNYNIWSYAGNGSAIIALKNISGGPLSEAVKINFAVKKVAVS